MVECEYGPVTCATFAVSVLIDTWWNVNNLFISFYLSGCAGFNRYMVECEYFQTASGFYVRSSFNRYMVECELDFCYNFVFFLMVLIDTWWNVNNCVRNFFLIFDPVLIDTWWNVNYTGEKKYEGMRFSFNRYMVECEYDC